MLKVLGNKIIVIGMTVKEFEKRQLKKGDTIICQGEKATIDKIEYQEIYRSYLAENIEDIIIEFWDTKGNFRVYKSCYDKGYIELSNN